LKRIGILTGGGDVQPLNAVINSAIKTSNINGIELIGFVRGWEGVIKEDYVELNKVSVNPQIGGTILKSSRLGLSKIENASAILMEKILKLKINGLIIIGGEDTLSNAFFLKDFPYILISKTIDNDVGKINVKENEFSILNYFTLGHATAAEKISKFVSLNYGLRTTAYSHERIIVVESMGMHAGWLAVSSSMGNPDFIIIPEFPLLYEHLLEKVIKKYIENHNVVIVISEGARWENGDYISADFNEVDDFGHPRFRGTAEVLSSKMKIDLKKHFDTRNVNFINPSYLYRSGTPNKLDFQMAQILGKHAIKSLLEEKESYFLTIDLKNDNFLINKYPIKKEKSINELHRFVPSAFYDNVNFIATDMYKNYINKITTEILNHTYGINKL